MTTKEYIDFISKHSYTMEAGTQNSQLGQIIRKAIEREVLEDCKRMPSPQQIVEVIL